MNVMLLRYFGSYWIIFMSSYMFTSLDLPSFLTVSLVANKKFWKELINVAGLAMSQVVSRRPLTAEARFRA
jgi:hypothetical protein